MEKITEIKLLEKNKDYFPEEMNSIFEEKIESAKKSTREKLLETELAKLDFNLNDYGETLVENIKKISKKFENDHECIRALNDFLSEKIKSLFDEFVNSQQSNRNEKTQFKYIELIFVIENNFKDVPEIADYKEKCIRIVYQKFYNINNFIKQKLESRNINQENEFKTAKNFSKTLEQLANLEKWLSKKKIKINNPDRLYQNTLDKFKKNLDALLGEIEQMIYSEINKTKKDINLQKIKQLIECVDFVTEKELDISRNIKNSLKVMFKAIIDENNSTFACVCVNDNERRLKNYFDEIFENMLINYIFLNEFFVIFKDILPNYDLSAEFNRLVKSNIERLLSAIGKNVDIILDSFEKNSNNPASIIFNNSYYAVVSFKYIFQNKFSSLFQDNLNIEREILNKVLKQIVNLGSKIENSNMTDIKSASRIFIEMKYLSNNFFMYKKEIDTEIDKYLATYIKENGGFEVIGKLALQLKTIETKIGKNSSSMKIQFY